MVKCPKCGSDRLHYHLFGEWECKDCSFRWIDRSKKYEDDEDSLSEKKKVRLSSKYKEKRYIP